MDIKIVGAGPAGLITGLKLLEAGFEATIIEKNKTIETTLCGEGLSTETLRLIPYQDWTQYAPSHFDHATFIFPNGTKAYGRKECHTMDRHSWFRAMAKEFEKRGGKLELGKRVNSPKDLKYDVLIGADGPFSTIGKVVGNKMTHIAGVQTRLKANYKYDGMEFFLDKRYSQEYSWIFAKGKVLNVGLLGTLEQMDQFVKDKGLADAEVVDRLGYNIPFFGTKIQEGNIILTGDAAGITNPLTKGGMAAATHVAGIIVDCLKEGKLSEYQTRVFSHPVMAPQYKLALKVFQDMTNEQLNAAGTRLNGRYLDHLPKWMKLVMLFGGLTHPKKMRTLMLAMRYANKYSW